MRKTVVPLTLIVLGAAAAVGCGATDGSSGPGGSDDAASRPEGKSGSPHDRSRDDVLPQASPPEDGSAYTPRRTSGNARIGVLSSDGDSSDHHCTAGVVHSPGRNMLVTAAHCAYDTDNDEPLRLLFAPGYRDGEEPDGHWKVDKVVVDDRWAKDADPDFDVAFLLLDDQDGKKIEDVLGGNSLGIDKGFTNKVKVLGYPSDLDTPVSCRNRTTKFSDTQMRIRCDGLSDGTSGSPWLTDYDPEKQSGTVIGVSGGYEGGGTEDDVSYATYFGADIQALYERAKSENG